MSILRAAVLCAASLFAAAPATAQANSIVADPFLEEGGYITIRSVMSTAPGELVIYDPTDDEVLARRPVHAGANHDVRIIFRMPVMHDVVALLLHGDQVVAQRRLNIVDEDFLLGGDRD